MRNCSPACHYPAGVLNSNWNGTLQLALGSHFMMVSESTVLGDLPLQLPEGYTNWMKLVHADWIRCLLLQVMFEGWELSCGICNEGNLTNKVILVSCSVGLLISVCWVACPGVWSGGCWGSGLAALTAAPWSHSSTEKEVSGSSHARILVENKKQIVKYKENAAKTSRIRVCSCLNWFLGKIKRVCSECPNTKILAEQSPEHL